jgi:hypothetical protein
MKRTPVPLPLPAHVADLWDAAKELIPDREACRRYPRLTEALIEFEKHLPFDDNGEVLIERPALEETSPVPLSERAIPVPGSVADLLAAARALLEGKACARGQIKAAVSRLDKALIDVDGERFYLPAVDGEEE